MISYRPLCSNRHRIYINRIPAARGVTKGIVAFISNEQVFSLLVHFLARAKKTEPKEGEELMAGKLLAIKPLNL